MPQKKIQSEQLGLTDLTLGDDTTTSRFIKDGGGNKVVEIYPSTAGQTGYASVQAGTSTVYLGAWGSATSVNLDLYRKGSGKVRADNDGTYREVATISGAQTLTNKRVVPRPTNEAYGTQTTVTPNLDSQDIYSWTGQSSAFTIAAPTGSPNNGEKFLLRFKDNGTARSITWNAIYRAIGVTLPTTTVANKITYIGMIYNGNDTKWDVVSVAQEA